MKKILQTFACLVLITTSLASNAGVGHFVAGAIVGAAIAGGDTVEPQPVVTESSPNSVICSNPSDDGNHCFVPFDPDGNHWTQRVSMTLQEYVSYTNKIPMDKITLTKLSRQTNGSGRLISILVEYDTTPTKKDK